jgi:hypothetical protein
MAANAIVDNWQHRRKQRAVVEDEKLTTELGRIEVYALGADAAGKMASYWGSLRDFWEAYFKRTGTSLWSYSILRDLADSAPVK